MNNNWNTHQPIQTNITQTFWNIHNLTHIQKTCMQKIFSAFPQLTKKKKSFVSIDDISYFATPLLDDTDVFRYTLDQLNTIVIHDIVEAYTSELQSRHTYEQLILKEQPNVTVHRPSVIYNQSHDLKSTQFNQVPFHHTSSFQQFNNYVNHMYKPLV